MKAKAKTIGDIFSDRRRVLRAVRAGVRAALLEHKLAGRSIVAEVNGKIVTIPPEKIPVRIPKRIRRIVLADERSDD